MNHKGKKRGGMAGKKILSVQRQTDKQKQTPFEQSRPSRHFSSLNYPFLSGFHPSSPRDMSGFQASSEQVSRSIIEVGHMC